MISYFQHRIKINPTCISSFMNNDNFLFKGNGVAVFNTNLELNLKFKINMYN